MDFMLRESMKLILRKKGVWRLLLLESLRPDGGIPSGRCADSSCFFS